jgi:hypothetical protein
MSVVTAAAASRAAIRKDNRRRESRGERVRFSTTARGVYKLV